MYYYGRWRVKSDEKQARLNAESASNYILPAFNAKEKGRYRILLLCLPSPSLHPLFSPLYSMPQKFRYKNTNMHGTALSVRFVLRQTPSLTHSSSDSNGQGEQDLNWVKISFRTFRKRSNGSQIIQHIILHSIVQPENVYIIRLRS